MCAIDDDAGLVQTLDHLQAEVAEAGIGSFLATVADTVLDVVGELDHADAEGLVRIDQVQVVLDRPGALEVEEYAELAVGLGRFEVGGALDEGEPGVLIDGADPIAQYPEGGPRAFEHGDGRPGRGDAPLDIQVDVLAAHRERTYRIDDDGLVVNTIMIEPGHA